MREKIVALATASLAATTILFGTEAASAFTLVDADMKGFVEKVTDLDIQDMTYDVTFDLGQTFEDLFGSPSSFTKMPTFWEDAEGAEPPWKQLYRR